MPVTIKRNQYYTKAEVTAMVASANSTVVDMWETITVPYVNGYGINWSLNKMHINKHTGATTGLLGFNSMSTATSNTFATGMTDLVPHPSLSHAFNDYAVYTSFITAATVDERKKGYNINCTQNQAGAMTWQGEPTTGNTNRGNTSTHISNFFYIGSKYGKIVTATDASSGGVPTYLSEGAFYAQDDADLICGKAWLKYSVPLPIGYLSNSYLTMFKNLWSGELLVQYSLYCEVDAVWPTITIPERFRPYNNNRVWVKPRYVFPAITQTVLRLNQVNLAFGHTTSATLSFGVTPTAGVTWVAGSTFIQGKPEVRINDNNTETTIGLWSPDQPSSAVPSSNSDVWPAPAGAGLVDISDRWVVGYTQTGSGETSWITSNTRTGMVMMNIDAFIDVAATMPSPIMSTFTTSYLPSYRYQFTASTELPVYFASPTYVSSLGTTQTDATATWGLNLVTTAGAEANTLPVAVDNRKLRIGSTGQLASNAASTRMIFHSWYLSNRP